MTVNTTNITSGPYVGNGLNDTYEYDFRVSDKTQLSVYETDDTGIQTLLTVDTDYTVNDVGVDAGGTIVRTAGNLPTDYTWYIRSNYIENQLTDFSSQGAFFPDVHEDQMDHITFLIQQLLDKNERTFKLSETIDIDGTFTIAQDAAARANLSLGFDGAGNLVVKTLFDPSLIDQTDLDKRHGVVFANVASMTNNPPLDIAGNSVTFNDGMRIDLVEYNDGSKVGGGELYWDAASTETANGGTIFQVTGMPTGRVKRRDDVKLTAEMFGAIDNGSDVGANLEAAFATGRVIKLGNNKTYLFDRVLTVPNVKSYNSTLKLINSATVTGGISDYLVDIPANAIIKGKLTVDANRANNQPVPPAIGTSPGVAVRLNGGGHQINKIRAINAWNNGINHPLVNLGSLAGSNIKTIEVDNCSGGAYLNFNSSSGHIGEIIATNMNAVYTGVNPHAVDLFYGEGATVDKIKIDSCDGTVVAGSAFYSGLTCISWNESTIGQINITNYLSTALIPLAISNLTAYKSKYYNTHIEGWSENRHIECTGMQYCSWIGGSIMSAWKEEHTSGANYLNTLGFIFPDGSVDDFTKGRDNTTSNNNTVQDFVMENVSNCIRDFGRHNRFINVRGYGGVGGYGTSNVSENDPYYAAGLVQGGGNFIIDNCDFSYMDNAGISANLPDIGSPTISNTRCNSNGIDTTAFINSRAGIRMDAADERVNIINYDGRDLAAENVGTLSLSIASGAFAVDDLIDCIHKDGTQKLHAGMRFTITDALGTGVHLDVRVEHGAKARDRFQVRAVSPTSGTLNPNTVALTGTFAGTIGGKTITGSGSALRTEIDGKMFVTINSVKYTVAQVVSDTELKVEEAISATFSGQTGTKFVSSYTSTATQNRAYHGTYANMKGVQWDGVIDLANAASGHLMGNRDAVKTTSIGSGVNATFSLNKSFSHVNQMYAHATASGGLEANASVTFPSANQVQVYNWGPNARSFMVTVEE